MPAITPSRRVFLASGLMRSTRASPASMSTPASLYEMGGVAEELMEFKAWLAGRLKPAILGVAASGVGRMPVGGAGAKQKPCREGRAWLRLPGRVRVIHRPARCLRVRSEERRVGE